MTGSRSCSGGTHDGQSSRPGRRSPPASPGLPGPKPGGAGSGFTARIITNPDYGIAEDRTVTATGSYSATAPQSGDWAMQMATFKGAGQ